VGTPEPDQNDPHGMVNAINEAINQGEQCHIKGKIHLYKVTGKIMFSFNSKLYLIQELQRRYPDQFNKLKLTHIIKSLTFGEVSQHIHILLRFGANDHTNFDMM